MVTIRVYFNLCGALWRTRKWKIVSFLSENVILRHFFGPNSLNFGPKCINVYIRRFVSSRRIDWYHFYSNAPHVAPSICRKPTFENWTINFTSMNSRFNNPLNIKNNTWRPYIFRKYTFQSIQWYNNNWKSLNQFRLREHRKMPKKWLKIT